jgi:hypothetical protein
MMLKKIVLGCLLLATALPGIADEIPEGGKRLNAFAVDKETTIEQVFEKTNRYLATTKPRLRMDDYVAILEELKDTSRYQVVTAGEFAKTQAPDKVLVFLRHDVDGAPETALRMAQEENKRGFKGSYFFRPTSLYYGQREAHRIVRYASMDQHYRKFQALGAEIGVHTDLLHMKVTMDIDPLAFQKDELKYWRENGFPTPGSVSNGDALLRQIGVNNTWIFSEFGKKGSVDYKGKRYTYGDHSVKDFGFEYEAYRNSQNKSISDIGLKYKNGDEFVAAFRQFKPGDRVSFLSHPMWWRANEVVQQVTTP